uniref:Serine/threonine-protein kinase WNK CCTL2 domain-containing protein n=1 Tax=Timema bartmani TaxID=61472 RepID=A0A7R9F3P0_9NEOP|nr:unnamed protein product [Timema bartmani]
MAEQPLNSRIYQQPPNNQVVPQSNIQSNITDSSLNSQVLHKTALSQGIPHQISQQSNVSEQPLIAQEFQHQLNNNGIAQANQQPIIAEHQFNSQTFQQQHINQGMTPINQISNIPSHPTDNQGFPQINQKTSFYQQPLTPQALHQPNQIIQQGNSQMNFDVSQHSNVSLTQQSFVNTPIEMCSTQASEQLSSVSEQSNTDYLQSAQNLTMEQQYNQDQTVSSINVTANMSRRFEIQSGDLNIKKTTSKVEQLSSDSVSQHQPTKPLSVKPAAHMHQSGLTQKNQLFDQPLMHANHSNQEIQPISQKTIALQEQSSQIDMQHSQNDQSNQDSSQLSQYEIPQESCNESILILQQSQNQSNTPSLQQIDELLNDRLSTPRDRQSLDVEVMPEIPEHSTHLAFLQQMTQPCEQQSSSFQFSEGLTTGSESCHACLMEAGTIDLDNAPSRRLSEQSTGSHLMVDAGYTSSGAPSRQESPDRSKDVDSTCQTEFEPTSLEFIAGPQDGSAPTETAGERRARRSGTKRRTRTLCPKLTVLSLTHGGTELECQLESSKKTVTFKCNTQDMVPINIANNLMSGNLLQSEHTELFIELIEDIARQLKENPDRLPVVAFNQLDSPVASRKPRDRERDPSLEPQARRDETVTISKLVDPGERDRVCVSGPSSPMHVLTHHPLAGLPSPSLRQVSRFLVSSVSEDKSSGLQSPPPELYQSPPEESKPPSTSVFKAFTSAISSKVGGALEMASKMLGDAKDSLEFKMSDSEKIKTSSDMEECTVQYKSGETSKTEVVSKDLVTVETQSISGSAVLDSVCTIEESNIISVVDKDRQMSTETLVSNTLVMPSDKDNLLVKETESLSDIRTEPTMLPARKISRFSVSTVNETRPLNNLMNIIDSSDKIGEGPDKRDMPGSTPQLEKPMKRIDLNDVKTIDPEGIKELNKEVNVDIDNCEVLQRHMEETSDQAIVEKSGTKHGEEPDTRTEGKNADDQTGLNVVQAVGGGTIPVQESTPENTIIPGSGEQETLIEQSHHKLSQQNSLDKATADASANGPQTIADLQHKLIKLTSQPSELLLTTTGTPPSHPATPHVQQSYETYMQTLQQKLASISMPGGQTLGPLSPQSTLHAGVASATVLPALEVITQPVLHTVDPGGVEGAAQTALHAAAILSAAAATLIPAGVIATDMPIALVQPVAVIASQPNIIQHSTTLAMEEVESVSTTTLVPGTRGMGAILFLVRRNFFFFRTLVMRAGPLFFLPATTEWELSPRNATQHS